MTTEHKITLFGFQAGPEGFVRYGIDEPIDYLFMRVLGGRGSGKSMGGALRLLRYIGTFPGSVGMVTAPVYDTIRRVTLPAIYNAFALAGWVRGVDYEYAEQKKILEVNNEQTRATIYFGSTEIPQNLRGPDLHFLWMDEPRDSLEIAFLTVQPTLRGGGGYPHQAWFTTTPAGKRHWLRKIFMPDEFAMEFGEDEDDGKVRPFQGHYRSYNAHTWDNPYPEPMPLTEEQKAKMTPEELGFHKLGGGMKLYLTNIRNYGGESSLYARQEFFGEELMMEGLVYPDWNPDYHMKPESEWPVKKPRKIAAGVDFGFENPFVVLVGGMDGEGRIYILDEYVKRHLSEEQMVDLTKGAHKKWSPQTYFCDTEDPGKIRALRWAKLPALSAMKKRELGIDHCTAALNATLSDGSQAFFVSPRCVNFRREIETWIRDEVRLNKDPNEMPRTGGHDVMDAFRYLIEGMKRLWSTQGGKAASFKTRFA